MDSHSQLYPPEQAAVYLGNTPPATLQWWRHRGCGPIYLKIGRRVFYRQCDLDAFIKAGKRIPESGVAA